MAAPAAVDGDVVVVVVAVAVAVVDDADGGARPLLQPMEQKMRPRRGRNGRPSSDARQVWQQKQPSVACQCWPSCVI